MSSTQNTRERLKTRMLKKKASEAEAFIKAHQMATESVSFMNTILIKIIRKRKMVKYELI